MEKVTIGMPVYNGGKFVSQAIDSLIRQRYENWELIISDNCSEDGTELVCRECQEKDPRIKYIRQDRNIGAYANFLFLSNQGDGGLFMWAAHDDLWDENYLARAVAVLSERRRLGFVFPGVMLKSIRYRLFKVVNCATFDCVECDDSDERVLGFLNLHPYSHKLNMVYSLYRREILCDVLGQVGLEDEDLFCIGILSRSPGYLYRDVGLIKRSLKKWPAMTGKRRISPEKEKVFQEKLDVRFQKLCKYYPHLVDQFELVRKEYKARSYGEDYRIIDNDRLFVC